jgi:hypothetical protein
METLLEIIPQLAILPILGAIGGGLLAGAGSYFGQKEANTSNRQINEGNKSWQEYMSNTAHQREVNDLREAGLNPILSATKGAGANTPTPGMARMESALGAGVNSARDAFNLAQTTRQTDSNVGLQTAQGTAQIAQAQLANSTAKNTDVKTIKENISMPAHKKESELRAITADYDKKNAFNDAVLKRVVPGTTALKNVIDTFKHPSIPIRNRTESRPKSKSHGTWNRNTGEIYD